MKQERDIVDELREIQRMNTTLHGAQMAARAADEIERLRGMLEVQDEMVKHYVEERDEARSLLSRDAWDKLTVRDGRSMSDEDEFNPWLMALLASTKQVEKMRAERDAAIRERDEARRERDDARRWICRDCETHSISAQEMADANGWDCFKDEA